MLSGKYCVHISGPGLLTEAQVDLIQERLNAWAKSYDQVVVVPLPEGYTLYWDLVEESDGVLKLNITQEEWGDREMAKGRKDPNPKMPYGAYGEAVMVGQPNMKSARVQNQLHSIRQAARDLAEAGTHLMSVLEDLDDG